MTTQRVFDTENGPAVTASPERRMWCDVVRQALFDLSITASAGYMKKDRAEAEAWFRPGNRDFLLVCELAGINAAAVLEHARAIMRAND